MLTGGHVHRDNRNTRYSHRSNDGKEWSAGQSLERKTEDAVHYQIEVIEIFSMRSQISSLKIVMTRGGLHWGEFRQHLDSFVDKLFAEQKASKEQLILYLWDFIQVYES